MAKSKSNSPGARSRARDLIVQSLYQKQLTDHDIVELLRQFHDRPDYARVDQSYYDDALKAICENREAIEKDIDALADRPVANLDPVEKAILMLGFYELQSRPDVPFKVVINECVNLAKRFGAVDGYKYINALLDRAVKKLRPED
jgi:N utilization substance protein B